MNHHHATGVSAPASVVLDVGPGIGALVIYTGAHRCGEEIEVSPVAAPGSARTHAAVRERANRAGSAVFGAVIADLPAGDYTVWRDPDTPHATVHVASGRVTEYRWPEPDSGDRADLLQRDPHRPECVVQA